MKVLQVEDLDDDALVMPVGSIGAPSVSNEKIASEEELYAPAEVLKKPFQNERKRLCRLKLAAETPCADCLRCKNGIADRGC